MDEAPRLSGVLTNREFASIIFQAAFLAEVEQPDRFPPGVGRVVYPELFRAVAYSVEHYGYLQVILKLEEIAAFSRSLEGWTGGRGWTSAESARQSFYKLDVPIAVTTPGRTVTFNVELLPRTKTSPDRMVISATLSSLNVGILESSPNAENARFVGADLGQIHGELDLYFEDRAILHAGHAAISGLLSHEPVPLIAGYPYHFGKAPEAFGVDWGSGSPAYYRKGRTIVHTFRSAGVFRPRIIRKGHEAEPFPFDIEVMTRQEVAERLRQAGVGPKRRH